MLRKFDYEACQIDPAPFQLVERTSLYKVSNTVRTGVFFLCGNSFTCCPYDIYCRNLRLCWQWRHLQGGTRTKRMPSSAGCAVDDCTELHRTCHILCASRTDGYIHLIKSWHTSFGNVFFAKENCGKLYRTASGSLTKLNHCKTSLLWIKWWKSSEIFHWPRIMTVDEFKSTKIQQKNVSW